MLFLIFGRVDLKALVIAEFVERWKHFIADVRDCEFNSRPRFPADDG